MHTIHQPHDKFFKQSMSDIRVAREFFETYLPADVLALLDLSTLKLENTNFINRNFKLKNSDLIYSVKMPDGRLFYIYLLCEHQSTPDKQSPFRGLVYRVRLMEFHKKQHPNKPLPLVLPIVFYTGKTSWQVPKDIYDMFGDYSDLARQLFLKPYTLIDVHRMKDEDLRKQLWSGLMCYVFKRTYRDDVMDFTEKCFPWLREIEKYEGFEYGEVVLTYVLDELPKRHEAIWVEQSQKYLTPALEDKAMSLLALWEERGYKKGVEQGIDQGVLKERTNNAKKMLKEGFALDTIMKITGLSKEQIESLEALETH